MTTLLKDRNGSAYLWAAVILLAMVILAATVYNGMAIYAKYQAAETELQRAATATVDGSMQNAAVRDLALDIPTFDAEKLFFNHLREMSYEQSDGNWVKRVDGKAVCTLAELAVETDGRTMTVTAVLAVPLMWETGGMSTVRIPIQTRCSVLYIKP